MKQLKYLFVYFSVIPTPSPLSSLIPSSLPNSLQQYSLCTRYCECNSELDMISSFIKLSISKEINNKSCTVMEERPRGMGEHIQGAQTNKEEWKVIGFYREMMSKLKYEG